MIKPRLPRTAAVALAIAALATAPVMAESVRTFHSNGKPNERYTTDADGRKHGTFTAWYESGKKRVQCRYSKGVLDGDCTEFHENGKPRLKKRYEEGELNGILTVHDESGGVVHRVHYRKDRVLLWADPRSRTPFDVYPVAREEIVAKVAELRPRDHDGTRDPKEKFAERGSSKRPYTAGSLRPEYLAESLRHLQVYRFLCGLPWDLELDSQFNSLAQHAALVCAALGELDHEPKRPDGMDADQYDLGRRGAGSSNLHQQQATLREAIDGFFADEDASNIERVGHRAWCLNPQMQRTGFGEVDGYFAMYAFDRTRTMRGKGIDTICFPAQGYFPTEYFDPTWPWSVTFPTGKYGVPKKSELTVDVFRLDDNLMRGKKIELDYLGVRGDSYGMGHGVVFRPKFSREDSLAGNRFLASLRWGPNAKSMVAIDYVVEFFSLAAIETAAAPDDAER